MPWEIPLGMRAWPNTGITMLRVFIREKILHLTFVGFCSTIHSTTFCWESSLSPSGITLSLLIYSTLIDTVCPGEQRELVLKYFSCKRRGTFVELMTVRSEWKRHMEGSVVIKIDLVYTCMKGDSFCGGGNILIRQSCTEKRFHYFASELWEITKCFLYSVEKSYICYACFMSGK